MTRSSPLPLALLALLALGLALAAGCGGSARTFPPADAGEVREPVPREGVHHVVRRGQTLWRIARVYGVPIDAIVRANGLGDATRIEVGQKLLIPGADRVLEVPPAPQPLPGPGETREAPPPPSATDWSWPVSGPITSTFGAPRSHGQRRHLGIDIAAPRGTPVRAARNGRVVSTETRSGYGRTVVIEHDEGFSTLYAHLSRVTADNGRRVRAGDVIGRVGTTGNANGAHLHFEIRHRGRPVDPRLFLP